MFNLLKKHGATFTLVAVLGIIVFFSACNQPMGLGKPIDWDPPILTLDPGSNPRYVGVGTKLSGTVTDNVAVDRVILRNAETGEQLFLAKFDPNRENGWYIELEFGIEDNNKKMAVEVVAYDRAGNSGEPSIAAITLIIDLSPPVINASWIQRTDVRTAYLEPWFDLTDLVRTDPRGERSANVNRYQNGKFHIYATVSEDETRIESLVLNIYDDDKDSDEPLLSILEPLATSTYYSPRWLIDEAEILAAGEAKWPGYTAAYNAGTQRSYYRVDIVAYDRGKNGSGEERERVNEQGHFCMWIKGDEPKGILDSQLPQVVPRGTPLPVEFFDDDALDWAYTDLFKKKQWEEDIGGAPATDSDEVKLEWLIDELHDNNNGMALKNWEGTVITPLGVSGANEKWQIVPTGNTENDYGDYVLFTLVADKKLPPHPASPGDNDRITSKPQIKARVYRITVIDDSLPVIVFDTVNTTETEPPYNSANHPGYDTKPGAGTGDSPEENTFPRLTGGQTFEINGYILRENTGGYESDGVTPNASNQSGVAYFRMAWIPANMDGGPDKYIRDVQNAMLPDDHPDKKEGTYPDGVQYWHFTAADAPTPDGGIPLVEGTPQKIGTDDDNQDLIYRKQVFRKTFDILGGPDDKNPAWNNFTYNGTRENDIKLFVFCAIDKMPGKNPVFRTLRLLGSKTPPTLTVYDVSSYLAFTGTDAPPDFYDPTYVNSTTGLVDEAGRLLYEADLKAYQSKVYAQIAGVTPVDTDKTESYHTYTRGATLKYQVTALAHGQLAVESVSMRDITRSPGIDAGHSPTGSDVLTYAETLPEVTQRVFLFTAIDTLGNRAQIQRTMAVTSTAFLQDITTVSQTGTYGIGKTITLRANFSGQIELNSASAPNHPLLNIRHSNNIVGNHVYKSIESNPTTPYNKSDLALEFDFTVAEGFVGTLETMYDGYDNNNPLTGNPMGGNATDQTDRPIKLNGVEILDTVRRTAAFTPGNSSGTAMMENWKSSANSLQASKTITLDGIRPKFDPLALTTSKAVNNGNYYFTADEAISFTLTSDKNILPEGNPVLEFQILPPGGTVGATYYQAVYQRPSGSKGMVFTYTVPAGTSASPTQPANPPNGQIVNIRLTNGTNTRVTDTAGNASATTATIALNLATGTPNIYIDRSLPPAPAPVLSNTAAAATPNAAPVAMYNYNPWLTIPAVGAGNTVEPWGATTEYSLDNGVSWNSYTAAVQLQSGEHTLRTRYIDRAGNVGAMSSHTFKINGVFPKLIAVSAVEPNRTYLSGETLHFRLSFDNPVRIQSGALADLNIILADRSAAGGTAGTGTAQAIQLSGATLVNPATISGNSYSTTLEFTMSTNNKEMTSGLYVRNIAIGGLRDEFNNSGGALTVGAGTAYTVSGGSGDGAYTCSNLGAGLIVDGIVPLRNNQSPPHNTAATSAAASSTYNRVITLTFSEPVVAGNGTITVRPRGNYSIPPVFENEGYYVNVDDGTRSATYVNGYTWVAGFSDVYNSGLTADQRNSLTQSTPATANANSSTLDRDNPEMTRLRLNLRTGQSAGPYKKMTQGLKEGAGYTGNYLGGSDLGPKPTDPGTDPRMVPDTTTKWVLDYRFQISNGTNADAGNATRTNIRTALNAAKWRWQEVDVTSGSVVFSTVGTSGVATITLTEPLLDGLQWDVTYPAGTFTDVAGNPAVALPIAADNTGYWFWSKGVQTPVVRVNRRSSDARGGTTNVPSAVTGGADAWNTPTQTWITTDRQYGEPNYTTANWNGDTIVVNDNNGWGRSDFNYVHYRIESETPGATIASGTRSGAANTGSAEAAWTGAAGTAGGLNWNSNGTWTSGTWVANNLIRRAGQQGNLVSYQVGDVTYSQTVGSNQNNIPYHGFRSFNEDATKANLNGVTLAAFTNNQWQGHFTYTDMQARKDYVVAQATLNTYNSDKAYEGVFRSVVAFNQNGWGGWFGTPGQNNGNNTQSGANATVNSRRILIEGSNIKNGMPSVSAFPVRDAEETGDNRFIKVCYFIAATTGNGGGDAGRFYWVSTEIVNQWWIIPFGGTHAQTGEVTNYLSAGYGDLSYSYNQR